MSPHGLDGSVELCRGAHADVLVNASSDLVLDVRVAPPNSAPRRPRIPTPDPAQFPQSFVSRAVARAARAGCRAGLCVLGPGDMISIDGDGRATVSQDVPGTAAASATGLDASWAADEVVPGPRLLADVVGCGSQARRLASSARTADLNQLVRDVIHKRSACHAAARRVDAILDAVGKNGRGVPGPFEYLNPYTSGFAAGLRAPGTVPLRLGAPQNR